MKSFIKPFLIVVFSLYSFLAVGQQNTFYVIRINGTILNTTSGKPLQVMDKFNAKDEVTFGSIKKSYSLVTLGDLLILDNASIKELVSNRLVIIGDFTENDKVETPVGEISGPLLITNILLSIENGDIIITWSFLLFISISYFLISLLVFYPDDIVENVINRIKVGPQIKNFLIGISYFIFLGIISSISYFLFHLFVNIFFLAIYLFLLDMVRNDTRKYRIT